MNKYNLKAGDKLVWRNSKNVILTWIITKPSEKSCQFQYTGTGHFFRNSWTALNNILDENKELKIVRGV